MKKTLCLVLSVVMLLSCISAGFCANAAQEILPLDGKELHFTMQNSYKPLSVNVNKQGKIDIRLTADASCYLVLRLMKQGESDKTLLEIDSNCFENSDSCTKQTQIYLAAGEYTLELEHAGENPTNVTIAATISEIPADNTINFPANKNVPFFLGEWEEFTAYRVVVKKDYRLKFTLNHNFPVGMLIMDANEKLYYVSSDLNATYQKPKTETINVCLKKGTYFFAVVNIAQEFMCGSGIGYIKMEVKPYILAPAGLQVITRKATTQTVSYKAVKGAAGYQVQCSDGGTAWAQTKSGTSLTCRFTGLVPGQTYKFRVRSYIMENGKKVYGAWSATFSSCTKPVDIKLGNLLCGYGSITTTWDISNQYYLKGYQVYYATDSSFRNIAKKVTIKAPPSSVLPYMFTQKGFQSGRTYYVKVRAYNTVKGVNYFGAWSNVVKGTVK